MKKNIKPSATVIGHATRKRAKTSAGESDNTTIKNKTSAQTAVVDNKKHAPCSVRDIINAATRGGGGGGVQQQQHDGRSASQNNTSSLASRSVIDPFAASSLPSSSVAIRGGGGGGGKGRGQQQQQQQNKQAKAAAASSSQEGGGEGDDTSYRPVDQILREGNDFFVQRSRQERALTKAAMAKIAEMKRVNRKGGDAHGFKYIIPKSAKKLANRLAGDVEIDRHDAIRSATTADDGGGAAGAKLLPGQNTLQVDGEGDVQGLRDDDRPMRKKKPRASKERTDFYAWQKWRNWTRNAENFLSRGRLHRRMFDSKRKFKSA